jgi:hypothetical protein
MIQEGPKMLLFTRNVLELTIDEIPANGGPAQRLLSIFSENSEEVELSRSRIYSSADDSIEELAARWASERPPRSSHNHSIIVESGTGRTSSSWRVTLGFFPDPAGALLVIHPHSSGPT